MVSSADAPARWRPASGGTENIRRRATAARPGKTGQAAGTVAASWRSGWARKTQREAVDKLGFPFDE